MSWLAKCFLKCVRRIPKHEWRKLRPNARASGDHCLLTQWWVFASLEDADDTLWFAWWMQGKVDIEIWLFFFFFKDDDDAEKSILKSVAGIKIFCILMNDRLSGKYNVPCSVVLPILFTHRYIYKCFITKEAFIRLTWPHLFTPFPECLWFFFFNTIIIVISFDNIVDIIIVIIWLIQIIK